MDCHFRRAKLGCEQGEEKSYTPCIVRLAECISSLTIVRDDMVGKSPTKGVTTDRENLYTKVFMIIFS
jgi:hypothetical protein